ncbi:LytR/AlgR family response regulator transcription factor [uncultured Sunxiuqinia sp.]|uniref:LytR/AlgR family response regulator transcription factor n=1 Tax=uncultured Sunxiuqinia sp. TaxID=1573825 RepID=UPI00374A09C3
MGEASSARQGIELINLLDPELVFLDIEMPGNSGFDLLSELREIKFELIFVTAYNNYALRAFRFNALDYILKPIDIEELLISVDRATKTFG